ncbi:aspartate dehydrogenase [Amphibacillus indicireducens]|uniref:L-aspartate dehydrogenase n=1 Tax=Amphibacillus indicireducens TaxID=1076330 RepID=A0ABP7V1F8_9BACI
MGVSITEINQNNHAQMQIMSVYVRNKEKYEWLETEFGVKLYTELESFLTSNIDIVVEAATVEAAQNLLPTIIKHMDIVLISIGALVDESLLQRVIELAEAHQHNIHLPSGAIGGLDLLQNAHSLATVQTVALTTRKPAHSLTNEKLNKEKVIFKGTAQEAIKQFPKNINVSIALSLAGLGIKQTTVRLIADPDIDKNIHQVDVVGDFGEASFVVKNNPLPSNPKTSYSAALSLLGTLERLVQRIKIG